jgi:L-ornithine N5-monooxygenase
MRTMVYDILGIGFGPAGIALAAAIEDHREAHAGPQLQAKMLEARSEAAWQPGLLIRGTDINHHFLRDFATPRNPRSRFTFSNYLKENGRLFHFGHLGGRCGRLEWAEYVKWTAGQLANYVDYNQRVIELSEYPSPAEPSLLRVKTADRTYLARTVVINTGPVVRIPEEFNKLLGPRFFHTCDFLPRVSNLGHTSKPTFALIGSGQSCGEAILYLHDHFPKSMIYSIHRTVGFKLYDQGHFSNECYFPEQVDYFYHLSPAMKRAAAADLRATNYSAVDFEVSSALYWKVYEDRLLGQNRIQMIPRSRVLSVVPTNTGYELRIADVYTDTPATINADVIVLGTGYREDLFPSLLEPLRSVVQIDGDGGPSVSFAYRVATDRGFAPAVYMNGLSERTHGISDATSFSMMALKAERILQDILGTQRLTTNDR